ncbi:MAG: DUF3256 family protein [Prevotella sp.]|jgi:hypothetical protein|nr:DUF3256 family protein [Prevotella sp.]
MKRIIFIIALFASISVSAQNIGEVFLTMPDDIIFGLEAAGKEKLVSNHDDTTGIVVDRGVLGEMERIAISDDFISLQTSEAGTIQIKLLPLINDSKIICVVKTVCAKMCDSQIQFYTTKWMPIPQGDLFPKKDKDWFIKADVDRNSQDFQNAYAALDMNPIVITLSAEDTSIAASYDIENYLATDDYKKIKPYLIDSKKFVWDKLSYK